METSSSFFDFISGQYLLSVAKALFFIALGYIGGRILSTLAVQLSEHRLTKHGQQILRRSVFYSVLVLMGLSALRQLGFDLNVLLGAAGILTVALGFASQTAASNLISGLFLMFERPFSIGDVIKVGQTTGEVIAIDLLSVKLRTFDNLAVRIPNETMLKAEVTTLTKFPIRRFDMKLGVAYKEDLAKVKQILKDIAANNMLCLEEPAPLFIVLGYGTSSIDLQFSVWAKRENFLTLKNTMYEQVKSAFDAQGVEIPFPHVSLYSGSATTPIPVTLTTQSANLPNVEEAKNQ